ncbi:hypothetical protein HYS91_02010 [Candidatus Daviesbacteria bacterium]|nr:hypothetical protein [Candidatus Daviesbacteria bacterium]
MGETVSLPQSRGLLSRVLIARIATLGGSFVAGLEMGPDAARILEESGIDLYEQRPPFEITPEQIIQAVREGKLITHFPTVEDYTSNANNSRFNSLPRLQ